MMQYAVRSGTQRRSHLARLLHGSPLLDCWKSKRSHKALTLNSSLKSSQGCIVLLVHFLLTFGDALVPSLIALAEVDVMKCELKKD